MKPKYIFWGLVITVAALFSVIYAVLGNYGLVILSLGVGGLWLAVDGKIDHFGGTIFFLAFVALAVIASLSDALPPLPLVALSANLAAWDLSRFSARLVGEKEQTTRTNLGVRHLVLLAVVISLGLVMGVLPFLFQLAIPFVWVVGVALLALLTLHNFNRKG